MLEQFDQLYVIEIDALCRIEVVNGLVGYYDYDLHVRNVLKGKAAIIHY